MQKMEHQMEASMCLLGRRHRVLAAMILVCCLAMSSCSNWVKASILQIRPFTGFQQVVPGSFVYVDSAATMQTLAFARQIQKEFSAAQRLIERTHGAALESPKVYVCASESCYSHHVMIADSSAETGQAGRTVILNAVRLLRNNSGVPIFTHELSHIFWYQHGQRCAPRWWLEGVAVATSGGGAESISDAQAREFLREGRAFRATVDNGCFSPAQRGTLSWAAYYRQAAMFVRYLQKDELRFAHALELMRTGKTVGVALQVAYTKTVEELWEDWRQDEMARSG